MSDIKLKNCPFCGSVAGFKIMREEDYDSNNNYIYYDVFCFDENCFLGYGAGHFFETKELAAEKWNNRHLKIERKQKLMNLDGNL